MGSNMAEAHPVGFQWVVEARKRGAKVLHVDPRFTRTSALADGHIPIRAGSDIAFLGGIVNYILSGDRDFREYVLAYTNAATIVSEDFRDTEDLDGLFSGWDPETRSYDNASWQYEGQSVSAAAGNRERGASAPDATGARGADAGGSAPRDETLQHPRCVFSILKRHFARYTPQMVEEVCGVPRDRFIEVADALCANSGRERTSAFCYSVGWTQHSVGVQYIRTAAIIQLLLGNIGRPGGGIMALRGHASIQGSTDIPTLYDLLPGYLPMPHVAYPSFDAYVNSSGAPTGFWGNSDAYLVSLLKAWWGDAAAEANDYAFGYLPKISGDHSTYATTQAMVDGEVAGYFLFGQNPAVGSASSRLHRLAMAKLDWLVVRDLVEIESATIWRDAPEIQTGELATDDIATEVFLLPAAAHVEKDGTFTQTQRLLQWHHKAVEPAGDCRSDLWFIWDLGRRIREKLADSDRERDRPLLDLTWDYPVEGGDVSAAAVLREINGYDRAGNLLDGFGQLRSDGSTSCGCWIYSGCYAGGVNQTARRTPASEQTLVAPDWGWAWPANRRMLYNRASADPHGEPWSERKRYVWWDAKSQRWVGHDVPDFPATLAPEAVAEDGARADRALGGSDAFIMQADGKAWLYAPAGLVDGPLPTHYEPDESPYANPLYAQQANPARVRPARKDNPRNPSGDEAYPYVMTTYRLTEHHTAGGMSRFVRRLAELQPEMFCEVSPQLAAERGLTHRGWATIVSSRTAIEARVMVTNRIAPLEVGGRTLHQVGLPYHWGWRGLVTGDAANDLFPLALDPNVKIQEVKAATCDVLPGRRPRGPSLRLLVERHAANYAAHRRGAHP